MKKLTSSIALGFAALIFLSLTATNTRADIIVIGPQIIQPAGQGVVPTVLTLQAKTDKSGQTESGAIIRQNGQDVRTTDDVKNGVNSKTIAFNSLGSSGITNASQLGIFLDVVEPGNDKFITLNTLTLTAYTSSGTVLGNFSYKGSPVAITSIGQGGGKSDFAFGLDAPQAAMLQVLINSNSDLRLGLAASLSNVAAGPDQFFFGKLNNPTAPVPEPATMFMLGTGLAGVAAKLRKRRKVLAQ